MSAMSHGSVWTMPANRLHRPYRGQTARHVSYPAMEGALREAGGELYQKSWTKRERETKKENSLSARLLVELDRGHRTGLTHAENGRLHGVSQRTSTYAQEWCKKMRAAELQINLNRWIAEQGKFLYLDAF